MIRNYRLASLAILTMISLMWSQTVPSQANSTTGDLSSEQLLFNRRSSRGDPYLSIVVLDINTREERYLSTDGFCCATSWSPDGTRILGFVSDTNPWVIRKLFVMDADGRNRIILNNDSQVSASDGYWSPDSSRIYFWGRDTQVEGARWAIYVVPATGGSIQRLTELTSLGIGGGRLAISPDGSQIIFMQDDALYIMSAEGGEPRRLIVPLNIRSILALSPDGSQLAVFVTGSDGGFELHSLAADGSSSRLLVSNMGAFRYVSWSPDSSELLFIAEPNRREYTVLGIVNVQTNIVRRYDMGQGILEPFIAIHSAVWSEDGNQIVISAFYQENNPYKTQYSLYLLDRNVSQIQRISQGDAADAVVQWRPRS